MKFFLDTANVDDIREALKRGFASGITTNPSILAKEPKSDLATHMGKIIELLDEYDEDLPLSVEVFATEPAEIVRQAREFVAAFGHYAGLTIKIPIGWNELTIIHELASKDVRVNCTCIMSFNQAMMAAAAGASYVSIFAGRIRDTGYDAMQVIHDVRTVLDRDRLRTEIIVGSIRHIMDVNQAMIAGAHIATVPPQFWKSLVAHPKTTEAVNQFVAEFETWLS